MLQEGIIYTDLSSTVNELEVRKAKLTDQVEELKNRSNAMKLEIRDGESKIAEQNSIIEKRNSEIKELEKSEYLQKDHLERSKRIWQNSEKLGIDMNALESFMEGAIDFKYDIKQINKAKDISRLMDNESNKKEVLSKISEALLSMEENGWGIDSLMKMATGMKKLKGSREDTVKAFSDLEGEFSEISKDIEKMKKGRDAISADINDLNSRLTAHKMELTELRNERTRLEIQIEHMEKTLELERNESNNLQTEVMNNKLLIEGGYAFVQFIRDGKIDSRHLKVFANLDELDLTVEEQKSIKDSLKAILIQIYGKETGIIEFTDRKTLRIIDGKEYEEALKRIERGKDVENMKEEIVKMIDRYGNDHAAFISDMLSGGSVPDEIVPESIKKYIDRKIDEIVNYNLSVLLQAITKEYLIKGFPVVIESNGKTTFALVMHEDLISSLMSNSATVSASPVEGPGKIKIPTCLAVKLMLLIHIDPRYDDNLRAEIRKIYGKRQKVELDNDIIASGSGITLRHFTGV
jgi:TolA-binding protein